MPSAASAASSLVLLGLIEEPVKFVLFPLSIALFHMASSVINDLSDFHVDKINAPERVLPSGKVSKTFLQILFTFLFGCGLLIAFLIDNIYFFAAGTFGFTYILFYSYGPSFKNYPLGSLLYYTLSGSVAPYAMAALIARSFGFDDLIFTFLLAMLATCAVTGSIADYEGDIRAAKRTFPATLGFDRARMMLAIVVLSSAAIYPLLYYTFNFSPIFLIFLMIPLCLRTVLFYLILSYKKPSEFRRLGPLYRTIIATDMVIFALTLDGEHMTFRINSIF